MQSYMGYGFYLNATQSEELKKEMIVDMQSDLAEAFDEDGTEGGYDYYLTNHFRMLDVKVLIDEYGHYAYQDQEENASIVVYIKERMNHTASKVIDLKSLPQAAQDQMESFKKQFGISKETILVHWVSN
jgi:hypothetical protein